jgi:hypothetical protein
MSGALMAVSLHNKRECRKRWLLVLFTSLLGWAHNSYADADIGTITYVQGDVFVQPTGAAKHPATKGEALAKGETIETGASGDAVLALADHQRVYLKGGTLYRIDDYHFSRDSSAQNRSWATLIKGGLRVISGVIGHQGDQNAYQLKTQMATIGIRGTEWSVLDIGDCSAADEGKNEQSKNDGACPNTKESIVVISGAIEVNTGTYQDQIKAGSGTLLQHPQQSWIDVMPASQLPVVTPSPGAAPACL